MQVKCLYNFEAQHPGELTSKAGEILTIIREDIGEGWWEAKNVSGKCGLIPQSYLEVLPKNSDPMPPIIPPPPLPSIYSNLSDMFSGVELALTKQPRPMLALSNTGGIGFDPFGPPPSTLQLPQQQQLPKATSSYGNLNVPAFAAATTTTVVGVTRNWGPPPYNVNVNNPSNMTPNAPIYSAGSKYSAGGDQEWDSDWDEEDDEDVYAQPIPISDQQGRNASQIPVLNGSSMGNQAISSSTGSLRRSNSEHGISSAAVGTLKRNLNKLSLFKSGVEPYIMGQSKTKDATDIPIYGSPFSVEIINSPSFGITYRPVAPDKIYTCTISSPQKESKLKGLKSFIAYQLTCSNSGIKISRRYKHFDWLHERLEEKFTLIAIPPLPGKQVTGRYEEEFIEHRMNQLQMWVNRICRHPILSQCQVWQHFVTCTDIKQWKDGKRRAERDQFIGPELFNTIKIPAQSADLDNVENQINRFTKFIKKLDYTVAILSNHLSDLSKKVLSPSIGYFDFLLVQFNNIAKAFEIDERNDINTMLQGIQAMTDSSHIHWETFYGKYKNNLMLIHDMLYEYRGFLSEFPQILSNYRSALNRVKEYQKTYDTSNSVNISNLPESEKIGNVLKRMDVITYHTLAEMNYFRVECAKDFRVIIKLILQTFLDYFNQITQHISKAIALFDGIN